jgi:hypothetical protein
MMTDLHKAEAYVTCRNLWQIKAHCFCCHGVAKWG